MAEQAYPYTALDTSRHEIRLLNFNKTNSKPPYPVNSISASLRHVSLDDQPTFECLSYVWGDQSSAARVSIVVNGHPFSINASLACALRYIVEDNPVIWIDAICINQKDNEEKSVQVPLMQRIYGRASKVIMWLGLPSSENSNFVSQLEQYSPKLSEDDEEKSPAMNSQNIVQLNTFFRNPYWRRVWIIQEVALARKAVVRYGTHSFDFDMLASVCRYVTAQLGLNMHLEENWSLGDGNALIQIRDSSRTSTKSLADLLHEVSRGWAATNDRDKVYGLFGLAGDAGRLGIVPDYSRTVREVYIETAGRILAAGHLAILYFDVAYEDEATTAGDQAKCSNSLGLPSWVPDWRVHIWDIGFGTPFSACGPTKARVRWPHPGQSSRLSTAISIDGIVFDTLEYVDGHPDRTRMPWRSGSRERARLEEIKRLCDLSNLYSSEEKEQASWRVPVTDWENVPEGRRATEVSRKAYNKIMSARNRNRAIAGRNSAEEDGQRPRIGAALTHPDLAYSYVAYRRARYRRPSLTTKGYVGLVPMNAIKGDVVCLLFGASMPLILRQASETVSYKLVGFAFFHGMMDGELCSGKADSQSLTLV
jgi:hypothetical protein